MNKWRLAIIIFFLLFVAVFALTNWYWSSVCTTGGCSYELMAGFLITWQQVSLFVPIFLAAFLLLPVHYFRDYVRKIVWWLLPISALAVAMSDPIPRGFLSLGREELVNVLAGIWLVVTLVFVAVKYLREKQG